MQHFFENMSKEDKWVGVAFRKGSTSAPYDMLIMSSTLGPYVHCELLLGEKNKADAYSSYNNDNFTSGFTRSISEYNPNEWRVLAIPVTNTQNAKVLSLQLLDANIPYNSNDLWQCCVKALLPYETELECDNVDTWKAKGVFCSQMCLLFLRMLARKNDMQIHPSLRNHLENVRSRGCSPNMLHSILQQYFMPIM